MSKKDKNVKKNKQVVTKNEKRDYKSPIDSIWGKVLIWILVFGMFGLVVITAIVAIVQNI
ncbi:MAG TPA: hypothetical protein VJ845_02100 [Haploplasma sp.]|nr:hypothetical protein [Haploplasma sp.]